MTSAPGLLDHGTVQQDRPSDALLARRSRLTSRYRITNHLMLGLRAVSDQERRGRWVALTAASIGIDVAIGRWLETASDEQPVAQLAAVVLDTVCWCGVGRSPSPVATRGIALMTVPSAIERGYRFGTTNRPASPADVLSCVAPSVVGIASLAAARYAHHRSVSALGVGQLGWPVLGLTTGWLMGRRVLNDDRRASALARAAWTSERKNIFRNAGRARVVVDETGDSPHNIRTELVILRLDGSRRAEETLQALEELKLSAYSELKDIRERVGGSFLYEIIGLGIPVDPPFESLMLLTSAASKHLRTAIGGRSVVSVTIQGARAALVPGAATTLRVVFSDEAEESITLPVEASVPHSFGDPLLFALILGIVWKLLAVVGEPAVPLWSVLPSLVIDSGTLLSFRSTAFIPLGQHEDLGPDATYKRYSAHYHLALLSNLCYVLSASIWARGRRSTSGSSLFVAQEGALSLSMMLGRIWQSGPTTTTARSRQRVWLLNLVVLNLLGVVLGWRRRPSPDLSYLLTDWIAQLQPLILAGDSAAEFAEIAARREKAIEQWDQKIAEGPLVAGEREAVVEFQRLLDGFETAISETESLSEDVLARAHERLRKARQWLDLYSQP